MDGSGDDNGWILSRAYADRDDGAHCYGGAYSHSGTYSRRGGR
jgi:hypothetical protein